MAEVNSSTAFPAKRKPDPSPTSEEDDSISKHRKLEPTSDQTLQIQKPNPAEIESQRPRFDAPKLETGDDGGGKHSNGNSDEDEAKKEPVGVEEDKVELSEPEISGDSNAEDDGGSGEHSNGEPAGVDRKGKGILIPDKGKGKLMEGEEEEESDEEDSSSEDDDDDISLSGSDSGGDPLEEVDLNNILPSRTRQRVPQPGFYFNSNIPSDDDGDDSDEGDA